MPKLHSRHGPVVKAKLALLEAAEEVLDKHKLTSIEYLQILQEMQSTELKYMLRHERHGNTDTPAGWE